MLEVGVGVVELVVHMDDLDTLLIWFELEVGVRESIGVVELREEGLGWERSGERVGMDEGKGGWEIGPCMEVVVVVLTAFC